MKFNCPAKRKKEFSPRSSPTQGTATPAVTSSPDVVSVAIGLSSAPSPSVQLWCHWTSYSNFSLTLSKLYLRPLSLVWVSLMVI